MPSNTPPFISFLGPRYWPTWVGLALLRLLHLLPFKIQLALGRAVGRLGHRLMKRRAHIAKTNIGLCFPNQSEVENEKLIKRHFEAIGMGLFESAMSLWGSKQRITALGTVIGLENLKTVLDSGKGAVLLTGHYTPLELGGHILSTKLPIGAMYRPMKNQLMESVVASAREKWLVSVIKRDNIRAMIKELKAGGSAISFGYDQDYGRRHAVFATFFGVPAATITTASRLAKFGNAAVVPFTPIRNSKGHYDLHILPPLENFPSSDLHADTQRLNDVLEKEILKAPEQYFWMHRRFKTRPEGDQSLY